MELVGVPRAAGELPLDLGDRVRVEQVAQLLLAEQLAEQVAIERQRLRPPLGRRRVVLVHVGRDVVEEERGRVRRRGRALDVDEVDLARAQPGEQALQRRQVEDVLEALPVGLEHDRERAVAARDLEQRLRLQPLLPERRALAGPAARDQQRAGGVLAEARAEERRLPDLGDDEVLELARLEQQVLGRRRRVGVGQVQRDPVVRPDRLHLETERLAQARGERERPRSVHAGAERAEDAERASRRSRRGSARRRACGRTGRRPSRPPARGGNAAGCGRRARRASGRRSGAPAPSSSESATSSRDALPIAAPSSYGRPTPSPFQNGTAPGTPGAGETSTRSRVISSIRHVDAPSRNVWPARAS